MEALELHPQRYSTLIRSLSWRPLISKQDDFLMHSVCQLFQYLVMMGLSLRGRVDALESHFH